MPEGDEPTSPYVYVATGSRTGDIQIAARKRGSWTSRPVLIQGLESAEAIQIVPLSPLRVFLVASADRVYLVGAEHGDVIRTFPTIERIHPRTLQCAHSSYRSSQPGSIGLTSLTLCYTGALSGNCILQSFAPAEDSDAIWLRTPAQVPPSSRWCTWDAAKLASKQVDNPGVWVALSDGSAVGIRQRASTGYNDQGRARGNTTEVRHRFPRQKGNSDGFRRWEVWTASVGGRSESDEAQPLFRDAEQSGHLLISELGPMVKVGLTSVAFSFGNVIKLVTVGGHERFEGEGDEKGHEKLMKASGRRRKPGGTPRPRAWS